MQTTSRQKVIQALHRSRMKPYLSASGGNEKIALSLYRWHLELTASTQQILGITEVVLRNAMDTQLRIWNVAEGGTEEWLLNEPETPLRGLSAGKRKEAVRRACKEAANREPGHLRHGQVPNHDDVLSQIMFGMWKELLPNHAPNASDSATENQNRKRLWEEALIHAFPHEADPEGINTYWRVAHIHSLRNRVSHMDSLLEVDVQDIMRDAFALTRSIDPDVGNWVTGSSRVSEVLKKRPC